MPPKGWIIPDVFLCFLKLFFYVNMHYKNAFDDCDLVLSVLQHRVKLIEVQLQKNMFLLNRMKQYAAVWKCAFQSFKLVTCRSSNNSKISQYFLYLVQKTDR